MSTTRPCISLPSDLLAAYRAAGGPPLSRLVADAVRAWLRANGHEAPPAESPHPQTGNATAARWRKRCVCGEPRGQGACVLCEAST